MCIENIVGPLFPYNCVLLVTHATIIAAFPAQRYLYTFNRPEASPILLPELLKISRIVKKNQLRFKMALGS